MSSPHGSPAPFARGALLSSALPGALLLAACSGPPVEPAPSVTEIVIGTPAELEGVNELIAQGSDFNAAIVGNLFLSLLEERPDFEVGPPTFEPRLASSFEFSEDRLTLTFDLRDDVTWTDGAPVTAEDARFTWQAQISPDVAWSYSWSKESITDVEVLGPYRVRFHFNRAYASQLTDANEGVVLPAHVWGELPFESWRLQPEWFSEHLVTNGPFVLESWERQDRLLLARNPGYFEPGLPGLDRVVFRSVRDPASLLNMLLSGEIDFAPSVRPADATRIEREEDLALIEYPARQYTFISWNTRRPYFNTARMRRALAHAVDRQALVETLWFGHARVASSPIISSVWAHDRNLRPLPHDPQRAEQLLGQEGWVDGDGDGIREREGVPLSFVLTTNPGNAVRWEALQMIREQLLRVGVEARPELVEYHKLNAMNLAHDYDATLTAFLIDTSLDLTYALHTRAIDNGYNYGGYSNPEVDRLIDEANAALDPLEARPLYHRLQQIVQRDQPLLFLWEPSRLVAVRDGYRVHPNSLGEYYALREWTVATAAAPESATAAGERTESEAGDSPSGP
ncbi:MAG TPA: ABC transporter substrate-binding protein [Thermoanaerobaculia bacterium]|nr:ABC transporter substrate-binding protein [Thermoanaerobaculia bacterium]